MPTTPSNPLGAARALALSPEEERSENCYCSALPSGRGPFLPRFGHPFRPSWAVCRRPPVPHASQRPAVSTGQGRDHFLLRHRHCIQERPHRGFPEAPTSLMWPCLIVLLDPRVQIGLQFVD